MGAGTFDRPSTGQHARASLDAQRARGICDVGHGIHLDPSNDGVIASQLIFFRS
jgi:hypothetical protein